MKKLTLFFVSFFIILLVFGQTSKKFTGILQAQANITIYDRFVDLNKSGPSLGLQIRYKAAKKIKLQFDLNANAFGGVKILLLFEDGTVVPSKEFVLTSFAGVVYSPHPNIELGISAGPSFWGNVIHLGTKPSIGVYLNKKKSVKSFIALTHIYQRDRDSNKSFGFISTGLGIKIF